MITEKIVWLYTAYVLCSAGMASYNFMTRYIFGIFPWMLCMMVSISVGIVGMFASATVAGKITFAAPLTLAIIVATRLHVLEKRRERKFFEDVRAARGW